MYEVKYSHSESMWYISGGVLVGVYCQYEDDAKHIASTLNTMMKIEQGYSESRNAHTFGETVASVIEEYQRDTTP